MVRQRSVWFLWSAATNNIRQKTTTLFGPHTLQTNQSLLCAIALRWKELILSVLLSTNRIAMSDDGPTYVKLVSAEGHEFFVDREVAIAGSKTIRLMLEGSFREAQSNIVRFPDITSSTLEQVVRYLHYKAQYTDASTRIPEFPIQPEAALELLVAAKYLDC